MIFYEYFIRTNNSKLRIYCHSIRSKIDHKLGLKIGCFVYQKGLLMRVKEEDNKKFLDNVQVFGDILDSADQILNLGEKRISQQYEQLSVLMNYGKDNEDPILPKFCVDNNEFKFSSSKKPVFKGIETNGIKVNELITKKRPYLKTEMVVYSHNNKEKKIPIQEFLIELLGVKVMNFPEFYDSVVLGVGEKKSYGCGLIIL